jgi:hypothetical protein
LPPFAPSATAAGSFFFVRFAINPMLPQMLIAEHIWTRRPASGRLQ